jgi:glycerol transport system ATP-binding protein
MDRIEWQLTAEMKRDGINTLMPELSRLRALAVALKVRLRAEIAERRFDDAVGTIKTTYKLGQQLGGHPTLLAAGRVLQSGPTMQVFRRPATLAAARAFSDPPLNVIPARALGDDRGGEVLLGIRAHDLSLAGAPGCVSLEGRVELAEISGSETFIHLAHDDGRIVAQIPGVHELALNEPCTLYVRPGSWFGFGADGRLLFAPES